jgi:hypothetical protein
LEFNTNNLARTAQAHIKRALPAMSGMGIVETDDKQAKFRQREPHWNLPPEHAGLAIRIVRADTRACAEALTGNDKHSLGTIGLSAAQKPQQRCMRLHLRHAVQIKARFDRVTSARDALLHSPVERRKRGQFWRGCLAWRSIASGRVRPRQNFHWHFCLFNIRLDSFRFATQRLYRARVDFPERPLFIAHLAAPAHD